MLVEQRKPVEAGVRERHLEVIAPARPVLDLELRGIGERVREHRADDLRLHLGHAIRRRSAVGRRSSSSLRSVRRLLKTLVLLEVGAWLGMIGAAAIVKRALQAPIRQIAENAGTEGSIVVGKVVEAKGSNFGYDAQKDEYGDMIEKGIIDPAKVVRTALQDAASIAALLITTEAAIAEAPKKDAGNSHGPAGMGSMGGMDM